MDDPPRLMAKAAIIICGFIKALNPRKHWSFDGLNLLFVATVMGVDFAILFHEMIIVDPTIYRNPLIFQNL
jgi:hypothetical protein